MYKCNSYCNYRYIKLHFFTFIRVYQHVSKSISTAFDMYYNIPRARTHTNIYKHILVFVSEYSVLDYDISYIKCMQTMHTGTYNVV